MFRNCSPRVVWKTLSSNNTIMTFSCTFFAVTTLWKNTAIFPPTGTGRFNLPRHAVRRDRKCKWTRRVCEKQRQEQLRVKVADEGKRKKYFLLLVTATHSTCCSGNVSWLHHKMQQNNIYEPLKGCTHFTDYIKSKAPNPLHYMPNSRHFPQH